MACSGKCNCRDAIPSARAATLSGGATLRDGLTPANPVVDTSPAPWVRLLRLGNSEATVAESASSRFVGGAYRPRNLARWAPAPASQRPPECFYPVDDGGEPEFPFGPGGTSLEPNAKDPCAVTIVKHFWIDPRTLAEEGCEVRAVDPFTRLDTPGGRRVLAEDLVRIAVEKAARDFFAEVSCPCNPPTAKKVCSATVRIQWHKSAEGDFPVDPGSNGKRRTVPTTIRARCNCDPDEKPGRYQPPAAPGGPSFLYVCMNTLDSERTTAHELGHALGEHRDFYDRKGRVDVSRPGHGNDIMGAPLQDAPAWVEPWTQCQILKSAKACDRCCGQPGLAMVRTPGPVKCIGPITPQPPIVSPITPA